MSTQPAKSSGPLGRGLDALLNANSNPVRALPSQDTVQKISHHLLQPCPFQPRKNFSTESLEELAASIRTQGILQPLLVRRKGDHYEIIAGERRWRAAQLAQLQEIPVIVRSPNDEELLEIALIENLQRQDLNAIEEAEGNAQLQAQYDLTQDQIAQKVGKARASVANALRLLELESGVKNFVAQNLLSPGHAKVLLGVKEASLQRQIADRIIKENLSVRQVEILIQGLGKTKRSRARSGGSLAFSQPAYLRDLEARLRQHLTTNVRIVQHPDKKGKGRVELDYYNADDLTRLLELIGLKNS
ncbi:MAG: ParB/RepB/Spo0J family partition protein [Verrucomicrobiia bacterium]